VWLHRRGRFTVYDRRLDHRSDGSVYGSSLAPVTPLVATEDLIDANGVAEIIGLTHRNSVSLYQRRYDDMPRPVVELSGGRTKLWLRSEVERWAKEQAASGRARPKRRAGR
jgi:predicted DNA-binding transcriptional regulator AlpA